MCSGKSIEGNQTNFLEVQLEGERSDTFSLDYCVARDCSLSPTLFSFFVNDLLIEVEKAGLGVQLSNGKSTGGLLFADDFVDIIVIQVRICRSLLMWFTSSCN